MFLIWSYLLSIPLLAGISWRPFLLPSHNSLWACEFLFHHYVISYYNYSLLFTFSCPFDRMFQVYLLLPCLRPGIRFMWGTVSTAHSAALYQFECRGVLRSQDLQAGCAQLIVLTTALQVFPSQYSGRVLKAQFKNVNQRISGAVKTCSPSLSCPFILPLHPHSPPCGSLSLAFFPQVSFCLVCLALLWSWSWDRVWLLVAFMGSARMLQVGSWDKEGQVTKAGC